MSRSKPTLKKGLSLVLNLIKSVKYVKGEKRDKTNKLKGAKLSGIKMPLMNTKGNLRRLLITMISEVISVGIAERSNPNNDPRLVIKKIPTMRMNTWNTEEKEIESIKIKDVVIIRVITEEYKNEATTIPKRIW